MPFKRGLSDKFIQLLAEEAKKALWWQDVLRDKNLIVAIRDEYLKVYWKGQALFTVTAQENQLVVTTHEKFLLNPELDDQVKLSGSTFELEKLQAQGLIANYSGEKTLSLLKAAAEYYAGNEKKGCHTIGIGSESMIDCEIQFGANDRIDLATLCRGNDQISIRFWEAKTYDNSALRADLRSDKPPAVLEQIERYKAALQSERDNILRSYKLVSSNLIAIAQMGWARTLSPLIKEAAGDGVLTLPEQPEVGLIIFGYDAGQKESKNWAQHLSRLQKSVGVIKTSGKPNGINLNCCLNTTTRS